MKVEQSEIKGKGKIASRGRFVIFVSVFALLIIAAFVFILKTENQKLGTKDFLYARKAASEILNKDSNDITEQDFEKITQLNLTKEYENIKFVEIFPNLEYLIMQSVVYPKSKIPKWINLLAKIGILDIKKRYSLDLKPLEKLPRLVQVSIYSTPVQSLKPLKKLSRLEILYLYGEIPDIEPIKYLKNLTTLSLKLNKPIDLKLLKHLPNLRTLEFQNTPVSNIEPLKEVTSLRELYLSDTNVTDLNPILGLKNLHTLYVPKQVSGIEPLRNMTNLKVLDLHESRIVNIEPISSLVNLEILNLRKTLISDITPLKGLANLQILYLQETQVTDLDPLRNLSNLFRLIFLDSPVKSLEPLRGLIKVESMEIDLANITDLSPLKDMKNLKSVNFMNYNNISDEQITDLKQAIPGLRISYYKQRVGLSSSS